MIWNNDSVRDLERSSIRDFVASCSEHFEDAEVLDYGAGLMPYRDIVEDAGGDYTPFDRADFPGAVSPEDIGWASPLQPHRWDAILVTQVLQYVPDVPGLLSRFQWSLERGGVLVVTWGTNWAEVEPEDLHRFTASGMRRLLANARFEVERLERRAEINLGGFVLALGYGAVARA